MSSNSEPDITNISNLIKNNKLSEAKSELEGATCRDVDWHYLRAAIYYKQGLIDKSKEEFVVIKNMANNNEEYVNAYRSYAELVNCKGKTPLNYKELIQPQKKKKSMLLSTIETSDDIYYEIRFWRRLFRNICKLIFR